MRFAQERKTLAGKPNMEERGAVKKVFRVFSESFFLEKLDRVIDWFDTLERLIKRRLGWECVYGDF